MSVTVRRHFKTLLIRKKRLSERVAEGYMLRKRKDEVEVNSGRSKLVTVIGSKYESSGGVMIVEGPRRNDIVVAEVKDISELAAFGLTYESSKSGAALISKEQIDLSYLKQQGNRVW